MSPHNSDDDDGVPESITLSLSKKDAASKRAALLKAQSHDKLKRKEKNRARDRKLKERSSSSKLAGVEARAGQETRQVEKEDEAGSSPIQQRQPSQDGEISSPRKIRFLNEDDVGENNDHSMQRYNSERLPDHIFAAAFAQKSQLDCRSSHDTTPSQPPSRQKKPRRTRPSTKDIVVGSTIIRALDEPSNSTTSQRALHTIPPRKVRGFISKALNVKGSKSVGRVRGWERRPANLGVMKSKGPPANFVRSS